MSTVYADAPMEDSARRGVVFAGDLVVLGSLAASGPLCRVARRSVEQFLGPVPTMAQHRMAPDLFLDLLFEARRRFTERDELLGAVRSLLEGAGCDLRETYFNTPRVVALTSFGYVDEPLGGGFGAGHHPHRDTWYGAPTCQVNWWVPVYEFESAASVAFHAAYWDKAVANGSAGFSYDAWMAMEHGEPEGGTYLEGFLREPHPEEAMVLTPDIRVVCPPSSVLLYSAAQMQSIGPNDSGMTRFSVEFSTVNLSDIVESAGPPNVDSGVAGASLGEFRRAEDFAPIRDTALRRYVERSEPARWAEQ